MVDVLFLSAGSGTRVKDATSKPKALIEIKGVVALDYILEPFKKNVFTGNENFRINLNIRKDEEKYFKSYKYNKFIEEYPLGNAGAIKEYGKNLSDPFIVVHNDSKIINFDYSELLDTYNLYKDKFCCFLMVVKNVAKEKENGLAIFDNISHKLTAFTRDRYINCGSYCVGHETLDYIGEGFSDIDENLIKTLMTFKRIRCFETENDYEDWGK